MSDLFNYLSQTVQTAFQHSNFVSEKIYILAVIFAWGDALTSVGTAFMSKMIPLRGMAVLNNIFGWSSGLLSGSTATFVKHSINFPLNISRWRQMRQLIDKVKTAGDSDLNVDWLKPFMHTRKMKAGEQLFSLGEDADEAFVIISGEIELVERAIVLEPGALFGEMALFTENGKRTATAVCRQGRGTQNETIVIDYRGATNIVLRIGGGRANRLDRKKAAPADLLHFAVCFRLRNTTRRAGPAVLNKMLLCRSGTIYSNEIRPQDGIFKRHCQLSAECRNESNRCGDGKADGRSVGMRSRG